MGSWAGQQGARARISWHWQSWQTSFKADDKALSLMKAFTWDVIAQLPRNREWP
jgi:hypothetical protein